MNFIDKLKGQLQVQSNGHRRKVEKRRKESADTSKKFALEDDEVEDIFDILAKEHPEL